jgi:rubredoxin
MPSERDRVGGSGWGCQTCGCIFEPGATHSPGGETHPAWTLEKLSDDWTCPQGGSREHLFRLRKHGKDKPEPNG